MESHEIISLYDRAYSRTEMFFGSSVRPEFVEWCSRNRVASMRVLDVGCGDGRYSLYLAEHGALVTGVDFSEAGLKKLRQATTQRMLDINAIRADICSDPLPPGEYDLITIDTVMGHLDEECRSRLAISLTNVIKPGGVIYASVFTTEDPGYRLDAAAGVASELSSSANHYFAPGELRSFFAGFKELLYREFLEESRAHGEPHMHGYAVGLFRKA